jgi:hypothetical protein
VGVIGFNMLNQHQPDDEPENNGTTQSGDTPVIPVDRESLIPENKTKRTPETDQYPPIMHSPLWEEPVPLPYPVNTAGAEDSPFMVPCGCGLYFTFTPDVDVPIPGQLVDGVSGLWFSAKTPDGWAEPEMVVTSEEDTLDGCPFIQGDTLWFCSARAGYNGVNFFTTDVNGSQVGTIKYAGERLNEEIEVGELHISPDGLDLYFHALRPNGSDMDIWVTHTENGTWSEPENVKAVNSLYPEGMPYITEDGSELWFNRQYLGSPAIFRSKKVDGEWTEPELIISQFAGEPNLDSAGNVYFVHHYFEDGKMIEADIYLARKKKVISFDNPALPPRGFYMGYLPMPPNNVSLVDSYEQAAHEGEIVPVWGKPSTYYELPGDLNSSWGSINLGSLIRGNGLAPLVHMSFIDAGITLKTPPGLEGSTLSSPEWRRNYTWSAVKSVEIARPKYISLGNEVNRWYETHGLKGENSFMHWISLYEDTYDLIKELSPETIVFCTFSREMVSELREADLSVLELFNPEKMDMLVVTSYPYALPSVDSPDDLPDDYYKRAADMMPGKSFGFSEISWSSHEAFGGEEGQFLFLQDVVNRLTLKNSVNLKLLMWNWLTDLSEITQTGLVYQNGKEKMVYDLWVTFVNWE